MTAKVPPGYVLGLLAILIIVILYPVSMLIYGSFSSAQPGMTGHFTLYNYFRVFGDPDTYQTLLTTLLFAASTTGVVMLLATPLAFLTTRTNVPLKGFFDVALIIPFMIPHIIYIAVWLLLLSPGYGLLSVIFGAFFHVSSFVLVNTNSFSGMVLIEALLIFPVSYLTLAPAISGMNISLEHSARICGSSALRTLFTITLPVLRPALLAAASFAFLLSSETLEVPLMLGFPARIFVLTAQIYRAIYTYIPSNYGLASTYSILLMMLTVTMIYVYRRFTRETERYQIVAGSGYKVSVIDLGWWRYPAMVLSLFVALWTGLVPLAALVIMAFFDVNYFGWHILSGPTIQGFVRIFLQPGVDTVLKNTLLLTVIGPSVALALSFAIAYASYRAKARGARTLEVLALLPFGIAGPVMAVGYLWGFVGVTFLYGTFYLIFIAVVGKYLSWGLRSMTAGIVQFRTDLEKCSRICGATSLQTIRYIVVPLLKRNLYSSWALLAVMFLGNFAIPVFLYTPQSEVISVEIFGWWQTQAFKPLAVLSITSTIISLALVLSVRLVRGKILQ